MNCDKINTRVSNPTGYVCPVNRNKASLGLKSTSNRYIIFSREHANNRPNAGLMLCLRLRRCTTLNQHWFIVCWVHHSNIDRCHTDLIQRQVLITALHSLHDQLVTLPRRVILSCKYTKPTLSNGNINLYTINTINSTV